MSKLKVAIIGCGAIYKNHADALADNEYAELKTVVDIKEAKAKAAAQLYKCTYATDYHQVLADPEIDVINICTPHYLHPIIAIAALNAGKQVFTEKPMSISIREAEEMIETAKACKKHLGVCFQNRFNNTTVKAKEILSSGELGSIKGLKGFVAWFRDAKYYTESGWRGSFKTEGGGTLINQAIHTLDLLQWLGGGIESLRANVDTRTLADVIEVEDTADATFNFKNGARGIFYSTNCYTKNSPVEVEIHCEKGSLHIIDEELFIIKDGKKELIATDKVGNHKYKSYWGLSHSILINKFYEAVQNESFSGYVTGEDGIETIKLIDAIYKSSAGHKWIKL